MATLLLAESKVFSAEAIDHLDNSVCLCYITRDYDLLVIRSRTKECDSFLKIHNDLIITYLQQSQSHNHVSISILKSFLHKEVGIRTIQSP